ncbi:hypothetical protein ACUY24_02255 [Corynebacterium simulans]
MQRVAIVGDGPAALSTAERLIGAGMCVDLVCASPPSNPKTGPPSPAARNLRQSAFSAQT